VLLDCDAPLDIDAPRCLCGLARSRFSNGPVPMVKIFTPIVSCQLVVVTNLGLSSILDSSIVSAMKISNNFVIVSVF